jgi:tol-pal system protein YbgF
MRFALAGTRPPAITSIALLAVAAVVSAGCAGGDAERARRSAEVADLNGQLAEVKKNQDASARERTRLAEQVKAIDAQQAFVLAETRATRQEMDQLQKEVGQVGAALRELRLAVEDIERKAGAPAAAAVGSEGTREASPEKLYASAMASFRSEQYGPSVLEFGQLVDRFPQHSLASNSQYWIGEAFYRQRDFPRALAEFQKLVDGYPQSAQVPEALLKIGLCHRDLKDTAAARESFERVLKSYPGTNAASQARTLLSQLGGQGRGAR